MISVLMPTYNHERYISESITSFIKQKTSFPIELIINDDCSRDNTYKIALEFQSKYPDKIRVFKQEYNQGLLASYKFLLNKAKGKYIAILESDDFYIDEFKLQKQFDFLEANPEYGLIGTNFQKVDENSNCFEITNKTFYKTLDDNWYSHFLCVQELGAVSVCFSKELFDKYCNIDDYIDKKFKTFDYPVWLSIAKHSKCKYLDDVTAAYRILGTSISNNKSFEKRIQFQDSVNDIQNYIVSKYGFDDLSEELFKEYQLLSYIDIALAYSKFSYYLKLTRKLKSKRRKFILMHYFPTLWYIQHKIRIG